MRQRQVTIRRLAAALLCAALAAPALAAQGAEDAEHDALRRQVLARFEVMPLREGVALVGRSRDRRVEIVDGLVLDAGAPLSGAELRERLGADAGLVLRLSYLDNVTLRRLFVAAPAPPAAPVPAPQPPPPPVAVARPEPPATPSPVETPAPPATSRVYRRSGARIAIFKSVSVAEDEEVTEDVVAIGGRVRIAGRVRDEVVAIGGDVELLPTADVRGDITALGGEVTIAPGARHAGTVDRVAFGGWFGSAWPAIGWSWVDLSGAARWLTLAGTVTRVALLALAMSIVVLVARARVGRIAAAAATAPLRAGLIGIALQVLFVPALVVVSIGLAITIIGIPFVAVVVPLAIAAMFVTMLLGFTSLAHTLGGWAADRLGWEHPPAVWMAVLGLALIVLPTLLSRLVGVAPDALRAVALGLLALGTLVEYVAWTIGLGAAAMTGLGRWSTAPPPLPVPTYEAPSAL
jgi:hypothetical protein